MHFGLRRLLVEIICKLSSVNKLPQNAFVVWNHENKDNKQKYFTYNLENTKIEQIFLKMGQSRPLFRLFSVFSIK